MSEESVQRALSVIVKAELRHFCLINCNIRVEQAEDDDAKQHVLDDQNIDINEQEVTQQNQNNQLSQKYNYKPIEIYTYNPDYHEHDDR